MKRRKGLILGAVLVTTVAAVAASVAGWRMASGRPPVPNMTGGTDVRWTQTADGTWRHEGNLPACPSPIKPPVNLNEATSVLYPGQYRGGEYKPHGGFRFDHNKTNSQLITAPFDAEVVKGARYLAKGDVQYVFDFISPCGYMYRLGHLLTLSPKLQALADKLPMNGEGDSRDSAVNPRVKFKAGEVIATATGLSWGNGGGGANVFVDWGVYDLRQMNKATQNAAWSAVHKSYTERYAVCWFDYLSPSDEAKVRSLPASDMQSGKKSDYCDG